MIYSILRIVMLAIVGALFVIIGVAFDIELREKYHESAPTALIITGSVMGVLALLGYLQANAFKKGDYLGYVFSGIGLRALLDLMFSK
jgi:hypothetical protein